VFISQADVSACHLTYSLVLTVSVYMYTNKLSRDILLEYYLPSEVVSEFWRIHLNRSITSHKPCVLKCHHVFYTKILYKELQLKLQHQADKQFNNISTKLYYLLFFFCQLS